MHLLLTTSHSFLCLDTDSGEFHPLDRGRGLYYGIAQHQNRLYVAARNRLVSSTVDPKEERGEILIFDPSLQPCGALRAPFPLRDMHEIAWHDDTLWITCSYDNMIACYHPHDERWERWFPLSEGAENNENTEEFCDTHHFNSFLLDDAQLWLVAHNRGASELLAFSPATRALTQRIALGQCAHNLWRENGTLFTCSSAEGKILGAHGLSIDTGGFPRGIVSTENARYLGISALAERQERDFTTGKIRIYDTNWHWQKDIELPGEGLILDLKPLPNGFRPARPQNEKTSMWSTLAQWINPRRPAS